jgi:hypothetical protein
LWPHIENTIEEILNVTFKIKYQKLHAKLDKLMQEQIKTPNTRESFHPRLINKTDITSTNTELSLLEKVINITKIINIRRKI